MRVVLIQALVTLGGVAALSWEVLWQLDTTLAIGSSTKATALVLAATMAGITLGRRCRWPSDAAARSGPSASTALSSS